MTVNTGGASLSGVDVSHFQGNVDWAAVKAAGIAFAFAKASDGNTYQDTQFKKNWQGMQAAGLPRGAYHFYESNDDPVTQANNFLSAVGALAKTDLPPVIDIESTKGNFGNNSLAANLQICLDAVEKGLKCTPIIYTNCAFWNANLTAEFGRYPLWIARYSSAPPTIPNGWTNWNFWQYSESGTVPGVTGAVDLDRFAGSKDDLQQLITRAHLA
ncbi:MAG: glycosyl hydrolase family 25 [Burkholderiales bacterium]|nr:glycosyl hydrolase family 25 [Burkholderiales bacterium]